MGLDAKLARGPDYKVDWYTSFGTLDGGVNR
jgi:hypothetical protein